MEDKEMEYVLSNTNFMNWILKKLKDNYYIDDKKSKLNENDIFYAKKLETLYRLINNYAVNNNIPITNFTQYNLYYINYNDNVFFVYKGIDSFGCFNNTLDKKDMPRNIINFEDVRRDKIEEIINNENSVFNGIKTEITKLYNKGISLEYTSQVISKLLYNVKNEEKGFTYKKERKSK